MLGLFVYTLTIGHKSCNMLSIQNKLTLQKEIQTFVTNNMFLNPLPESGIELRTSCTQSECVTTAPPSQLNVSIVVKPFNCIDTMRRNVNKQS